MRFAGKEWSRCDRARSSSTPWTIDGFTLPPLLPPPTLLSDIPMRPRTVWTTIPRSPSPSLACKNFSFVHETARSTVVFIRCHSTRIVTGRRDAPILWTQMRHLRRTLSREKAYWGESHRLKKIFFFFTIRRIWSLNSRRRAPSRGFARRATGASHRHLCVRLSITCVLPRTVNRIVNKSYFGLRYRNTGVHERWKTFGIKCKVIPGSCHASRCILCTPFSID